MNVHRVLGTRLLQGRWDLLLFSGDKLLSYSNFILAVAYGKGSLFGGSQVTTDTCDLIPLHAKRLQNDRIRFECAVDCENPKDQCGCSGSLASLVSNRGG